jgi:hypothetical protein
MHSDPAAAQVFTCYDDEVCVDDRATNPRAQTRGILWVLRWAAALAVLSFSCGVLTEFAFCLAAEHTVNRAARAGALEATLPRATSKSIAESVMRCLAGYHNASRQTRLVIEQNGKPILGRLIVQPNDRISVHVAVPGNAVLPGWLQRVKFWRGNPPIEASEERVIPGGVIVTRNRKTRA